MPQKENTNERDDDTLLNKLFAQRIDCVIDQGAAVGGRNDSYTWRERAAHLFKFLLNPINNFKRVLAVPHDYHAAYHLPFAIQVDDAITEIRAEMKCGYVFDVDGRAVLRG